MMVRRSLITSDVRTQTRYLSTPIVHGIGARLPRPFSAEYS
ncbi:UNVERIFIED_ORG: hypothetical protein CLV66_102516 [Actinomadura viridilutea]